MALGQAAAKLIAYFDTCRIKRNQVDYDRAGLISDSDDLVQHAEQFRDLVDDWIARKYPHLRV